MDSLPTAFFAGVGLGIMEAVIDWNMPNTPTFRYLAFLVVILAALLLPSGKLSRGQESAGSAWSSLGILKTTPLQLRSLPAVAWARRAVLLVLALAFLFVPTPWSPSNATLD